MTLNDLQITDHKAVINGDGDIGLKALFVDRKYFDVGDLHRASLVEFMVS